MPPSLALSEMGIERSEYKLPPARVSRVRVGAPDP